MTTLPTNPNRWHLYSTREEWELAALALDTAVATASEWIRNHTSTDREGVAYTAWRDYVKPVQREYSDWGADDTASQDVLLDVLYAVAGVRAESSVEEALPSRLSPEQKAEFNGLLEDILDGTLNVAFRDGEEAARKHYWAYVPALLAQFGLETRPT